MSRNDKLSMNIHTFETIALVHIDSLYRFALYMAGNEDDAQSLVQNTYLKAYKYFNRSKVEVICKAWLLGILNDTFISSACDLSRNRQVSSLPGNIKVPKDRFCHEIIAAMNELPAQYRVAILLVDVEGLSYKEIASVIGCSIETVMSRLCRGRRLLGRMLQGK
jgi:RNA polymerase sigma-70 factor (ECF subfamily)